MGFDIAAPVAWTLNAIYRSSPEVSQAFLLHFGCSCYCLSGAGETAHGGGPDSPKEKWLIEGEVEKRKGSRTQKAWQPGIPATGVDAQVLRQAS